MRRLLPVLLLATSALLLALATPAQAGTADAPEIQDPAQDQVGPNNTALCQQGVCFQGTTRSDIVAVWITNVTATTFEVNLQTTGGVGTSLYYDHYYEFHATGATPLMAGAYFAEGPLVVAGVPTGATASLAVTAGGVLQLTVPLSAVGGAPSLTGIYAVGMANVIDPVNSTVSQDVAPDAGASSTTTFPFSFADPTDTDGDGLDDAWEQDNFGDLNSTGSDDNDADGLNNTAELDEGTDPNMADTDGDGFSDGAEVAANTDPLDPDSKPAGPTPTPTATPTASPTVTPTATPTPPVTPPPPPADSGDDASDSPKTFGEVMDKLKEDPDYLMIAGILAFGVVVLALVALLGRWRV